MLYESWNTGITARAKQGRETSYVIHCKKIIVWKQLVMPVFLRILDNSKQEDNHEVKQAKAAGLDNSFLK